MRRRSVKLTPDATPSTASSRVVVARLEGQDGAVREARFTKTFVVGSGTGCDLRLLDPHLKRVHLRVIFDGALWWMRDLEGRGETLLDGRPISLEPLAEGALLELGWGGPRLSLRLVAADGTRPARSPPEPKEPKTAVSKPLTSATRIVERFLKRSEEGPEGEGTVMLRRAFERVGRRSSLPYKIAFAVALVVLCAVGAVVLRQSRELHALRAAAERLFYAMKSVELENDHLEEVALLHATPQELSELGERRAHLRALETEYESFVKELGIYAKVPEDERVILRVARTFGECDVCVPKGFVPEVRTYIDRWRANGRLAKALQRLKERGYAPTIGKALTDAGLPKQYIYLALEESAFDDRAIGPPTRFGFAKGMWQFLSPTAHQYGLRLGQKYDEPVYDPDDERFDWEKATAAAVRYLKELQTTEAQASGILAMASYNWGHQNIRTIIKKLPATPEQRNFWRLLADETVPQETYDYVLYIFSAAVICENPRLFGFDLQCPFSAEALTPPG